MKHNHFQLLVHLNQVGIQKNNSRVRHVVCYCCTTWSAWPNLHATRQWANNSVSSCIWYFFITSLSSHLHFFKTWRDHIFILRQYLIKGTSPVVYILETIHQILVWFSCLSWFRSKYFMRGLHIIWKLLSWDQTFFLKLVPFDLEMRWQQILDQFGMWALYRYRA